MIPVASTLLLGIPQTSQTTGQGSLPWPNGSLIPARILSVDAPGLATIVLGSYRLQARVPPNTAPGHIWLEILSRELPAHTRILNEARVVELLSRRIAESLEATARQHDSQPVPQSGRRESALPAVPEGLPFIWQKGEDSDRSMLLDADEHEPRGMMQEETGHDGYALYGRLDLEHLQTVFFLLEQKPELPTRLKLRATSETAYRELMRAFDAFLDCQNIDSSEGVRRLEGRLSLGREPLRPNDDHGGHLA